jgi:hypothetical protein
MMTKLTMQKKYTYFTSNFDHHADAVVQCGAHCPMEHIPGFTQSHWMPTLGESLGRITSAATMVKDFDSKHKHTNKTKLLASVYYTFLASKLSNFQDPKWTLYLHY